MIRDGQGNLDPTIRAATGLGWAAAMPDGSLYSPMDPSEHPGEKLDGLSEVVLGLQIQLPGTDTLVRYLVYPTPAGRFRWRLTRTGIVGGPEYVAVGPGIESEFPVRLWILQNGLLHVLTVETPRPEGGKLGVENAIRAVQLMDQAQRAHASRASGNGRS